MTVALAHGATGDAARTVTRMHLHAPILHLLATVTLVLLGAGTGWAADIHLTPEGAGTRDGSTWENARPGTKESFQAAWDALAPGDALRVGSGAYDGLGIRARKGGEAGRPLRLIGEDRGAGLPVFTSNFDKRKGGTTFFAAADGVAHVEISGFHLKAYKRGVLIRGKGSDLKLANLVIDGALEGIRCDGGAEPGKPELATHDVVVADCRFDKFVKRGLRLQGGSYHWRIERCWADAGGKEWFVEPFAICFQLSQRPGNPIYARSGDEARSPVGAVPTDGNAPGPDADGTDEKPAKGDEFGIRPPDEIFAMEHDIELVDCVALNTYSEGTGKDKTRYWNGDGFCGESGARNFRFLRCVSMHHTDGGWDMKSDHLEFIDCISIDNKDNFRLWAGAPKLVNCVSAFPFKRGGSGPTSGLWCRTSVALDHCTFIDGPIVIEEAGKVVTFTDSIFIGAAKPKDPAAVVFTDCHVGDGTEARIPAQKGYVWLKPDTAFDSPAFPKQGFSSTRLSR
jgi:hypothetical protein